MALNPSLFTQLEGYGITDDHLLQLLGLCARGPGRVTWHIDRDGCCAKVELTFFRVTRERTSMRDLTHLVQKAP